jgi:hypothetical protein
VGHKSAETLGTAVAVPVAGSSPASVSALGRSEGASCPAVTANMSQAQHIDALLPRTHIQWGDVPDFALALRDRTIVR